MSVAHASALNIVWWNVNDLYHFDANNASKKRWPRARVVYEEKCARVDKALSALFKNLAKPEIIALGEITKVAASELRDRLLPDYKVLSLDIKADKPALQVAFLYSGDLDGKVRFEERAPIAVPGTPAGTRPMAVLDAITRSSRIRFVACHWQARLAESAEIARFRTADHVAQYCHKYLNEKSNLSHHIVLLGDLNEEPHDRNLIVLNAHRHRGRSQASKHWTDDDVNRVHLYNPSWRLLGEQHGHTVPPVADTQMLNSAGTYYWESEKSWAHLDHFIVSGGLLSEHTPYLNENKLAIVSLQEFLSDGLPLKFSEENGKYSGLSDHLPIFATINI